MSTMDIRRFGPHAASRSWATAKALDAYSRYYDIVYPNQEWTAGPAAAPLGRPGRGCPHWTRRSARRPAGSGSTGSARDAAGTATPALRPARLGRPQLVAGDRRRVPGHHRRRPGCSTSRRSPSSTSAGRARPAFLSWMCAGDVDRAPGIGDLHAAAQRARRHRGRPDRHPAGRGRTSASSPAPRAACGTRTGCAGTRRPACPSWTSPARTAACACGVRAAREVLAPLTDDPLDFGFMRARQITVGRGAGAGAAGHVRRRVRLGAVRRRRVHADAVGPAAGRPAWRGRPATGRSTRCGWRRATASGARTSRRRRRRTRPGCRSPCAWTKDVPRPGRRCSPRARGGRPGAPAALPRARRPGDGVPGHRAGAGRRRAGRPGHVGRLRLPGGRVDRVRLPAVHRGERHARRGRRVRRLGPRDRGPPEPLFDPENERVRGP